jgi:hypothetical protein
MRRPTMRVMRVIGNSTFDDWLRTAAPGKVVVAGDWHGNGRWSSYVIRRAAHLLKDETVKIIIHLGDFGFWPGAEKYLQKASEELAGHGLFLLFADGNHEWHDRLDDLHAQAGHDGPVPLDDWLERIWHLPRGYRWEWHGIKWLAVGGAGSPDWQKRVPGTGWWPQEQLTDEQVQRVIAGGKADVLAAHDCPSDFMPELPPPPYWWDLEPCHESSRRLQQIVDATAPAHVFHGHLHTEREQVIDTASGDVHVIGLDADGAAGNYRVVDTRTLDAAADCAG